MEDGRRGASVVVLLCVIASAIAWPRAQAPPQAVFRAGVDIVHLDVSVLDRDRRPVRGLTPADFTVLEDGKPQPVVAFAAIDVPDAPRPAEPAAWLRDAPSDVRTNDIARTPEGRLFVLVLDDGLIPPDPAALASAKQIARLAIDKLSPADQMAVVFTVNSRGAQNFTNERAKLLAAVDTLQQGYATHVMGWDTAIWNDDAKKWQLGADGDAGFRQGSVRTLEMVADTLIAAPQRRKAVIYVSPGVMADLESNSQPSLIRPDASQIIRSENASLVARLPELYRRMQRANVTIYAVDPTGLGGLEAYVQRTAAGLTPLRGAQPFDMNDDWLNPSRPPMALDLARRVQMINLEFLQTAAANTGGVAIVNTNEFGPGIDRIFAENSSYYLLGFSASPAHRPGSLHRLEVRVKRDGVQVRARTGYTAPRPAPAATTPAEAGSANAAAGLATPAVVSTLAGPVPTGDLPMRITLAPFAISGLAKATVAITLGLQQPAGGERGERTFELQVRAFNTEGASRGTQQHRGTIAELLARPGGDMAFDLLALIELPPGRHELRLAAALAPLNLAGSVFADVDVPDFQRERLSVSGVLLETHPPGHAGPLNALASVVPVVPTSRREFTRAEAVQAFLRVYQGGDDELAPAAVQVTLQDGHDRIVYSNRLPLPVRRFDAVARSADVRFDIPMRAMQPGSHLLTFDAQLGSRTVRRQLRFVAR